MLLGGAATGRLFNDQVVSGHTSTSRYSVLDLLNVPGLNETQLIKNSKQLNKSYKKYFLLEKTDEIVATFSLLCHLTQH